MNNAIRKLEQRRALRRLPYETTLVGVNHREAKRWCEQSFGQRWGIMDNLEGRWMMKWSGESNIFIFQFADARDRNWFILRWGADGS